MKNIPSDVDNDITVGKLGDGLGNDSLATTEGTGNGNSATLDTREKGVKYTLTDDERLLGNKLLGGGTGDTDGPCLHHGVLGLLAVELDLENVLGDSVLALGGNLGNGTAGAGRQENLVHGDEGVFKDGTPDITTGNVVADLLGGGKLPLLVAVEGGNRYTAGNVDALGGFGNTSEGTLDTVVDAVQQTGTELDGEGLASAEDGVANSDTG